MRTKHWLWALAVCASASLLTACGSSDDSDDEQGGGTTATGYSLVGKAFIRTQDNITSIVYNEVLFVSPYFVVVHNHGREFDAMDGWTRWNDGEVDCTYSVSGSKVYIQYEPDEVDMVLNIVDGRPEGWDDDDWVALGGSRRTISYDTFDARLGTEDMVGYYCADVLRERMEETAAELVATGDYPLTSWERAFASYNPAGGTAFRIVDGSTLYYVDEGVSPTKPNEKYSYVYMTKDYEVQSITGHATRTLYFYADKDYNERFKYVMNGNKIVTSGGLTLRMENGKLSNQPEGSDYWFTKF